MSDRQQSILDFFRERRSKGLIPPTLREVCEATGLSSTSLARHHLQALVRQGRLSHVTGAARGYTLPDDGHHKQRIAELEQEVARLRQELEKAKRLIV